MIDKEKVLTGLKCCSMNGNGCKRCPYNKDCDEMPDYGNAQLCSDAMELLKEQRETASEWLEDSDPGQVYGTTWACFKCKHGIHKPFVWNPYDSKMVYCPFCGARMYREVKQDADGA